jgi:hypothetical protein
MEFRAAIYVKINCHNYAQLFYILVIDFQSLIKDCSVFGKSHLNTCNFSGLMIAICQDDNDIKMRLLL